MCVVQAQGRELVRFFRDDSEFNSVAAPFALPDWAKEPFVVRAIQSE